jgi:hypothetical protein
MNSTIKDTIEARAIKGRIEVDYDDERPVMAFTEEGLRSVVKTAIRVCADRCIDPDERERMLQLGD